MPSLAEVLREGGYIQDGKIVRQPSATAQKMNEYVKNIIPNALQNAANQRADIDAALTMGDKGIQIGDRAAFARQMAEVPNLMGLTAFHGTPHTIRGKFDISKVGTGEGAQSYGHGMYFAESPRVAEFYKNALKTKDQDMINNAIERLVYVNNKDTSKIADALKLEGFNPERITSDLENSIKKIVQATDPTTNTVSKTGLNEYANLSKLVPEQGNLYKVDIPDEYIPNMLDWDKPLAEQTPQVQAAIQKLGDRFRPLDEMEAKNVSGERLYRRIENSLGKYYGNAANPEASAILNRVGIKGIRYKDAGSRTKDEKPTSNFVVFDPSEVKILEKNSKPMTRKEIIEQELEKVAK